MSVSREFPKADLGIFCANNHLLQLITMCSHY